VVLLLHKTELVEVLPVEILVSIVTPLQAVGVVVMAMGRDQVVETVVLAVVVREQEMEAGLVIRHLHPHLKVMMVVMLNRPLEIMEEAVVVLLVVEVMVLAVLVGMVAQEQLIL